MSAVLTTNVGTNLLQAHPGEGGSCSYPKGEEVRVCGRGGTALSARSPAWRWWRRGARWRCWTTGRSAAARTARPAARSLTIPCRRAVTPSPSSHALISLVTHALSSSKSQLCQARYPCMLCRDPTLLSLSLRTYAMTSEALHPMHAEARAVSSACAGTAGPSPYLPEAHNTVSTQDQASWLLAAGTAPAFK